MSYYNEVSFIEIFWVFDIYCCQLTIYRNMALGFYYLQTIYNHFFKSSLMDLWNPTDPWMDPVVY